MFVLWIKFSKFSIQTLVWQVLCTYVFIKVLSTKYQKQKQKKNKT